MSDTLAPGQHILLDACPGFDIDNNKRDFYGEFVIDHLLPHEVGFLPVHTDRHIPLEYQTVFVNLPLPVGRYTILRGDAS